MRSSQRAVLRALASVAYFVVPAIASAQATAAPQAGGSDAEGGSKGIQEIIVTAERRSNDVQKTAAAVSVRSGSELTSQGKYLLRQVLDDIPGVVALENNSRNTGSADVQGNNITIRGITPGETAGAGFSQISPAPATAVYVDGIYEGVGSGYDLERVEVLRGPQGTLYGRSATAGVVAFHTRNPTIDDFNANGSVEYGSYSLQHYTAAANIPLGSTIAARISGDYRDQDRGYFGEGDRGKRKRLNARAKVLWEPNDDLSVLLGFAYERDRAYSGGNETTADPSLNLTTVAFPIFTGLKEQKQYWGEINWDLGPVALTYLGAYRTWEQNDNNLLDGNFIFSGASLQQLIETPVNNFHTQELRISSKGDSSLRWLAGVFYYENKLRTSLRNFLTDADNVEIALQSLTADEKKTENLGFFAEATYSPDPALRLTLGARYDDTRIKLSEFSFENDYSLCGTILQFGVLLPPGETCTGPGQASVPPTPGVSAEDLKLKFHNFNYKARVEYDLTLGNMLYASVSTGFRPGDAGFSVQQENGIRTPVLNIYDTEKLTSIEVGSKNRFLNNTLQVNLSGFYYIYDGFQTTFQPNTPSPIDFATPGAGRRTTVPARNLGGELELLYQPTQHDRIMINYNYVQSRWVDKPADFASAQPETKRAMTPHTVTAAYQHTFDIPGGGTIAARIDGKFESAHRTDDLHADLLALGLGKYVQVDDRLVGNAQLTFMTEDKRYSLTAYVRNFTNAKYPTYVIGGDPTSFDVNFVDPRIFGIVASANF